MAGIAKAWLDDPVTGKPGVKTKLESEQTFEKVRTQKTAGLSSMLAVDWARALVGGRPGTVRDQTDELQDAVP